MIPKSDAPEIPSLNRGTKHWHLHSSKLTWKWRGAALKTSILYVRPSVGFHVDSGEGTATPNAARRSEALQGGTDPLNMHLSMLVFVAGTSIATPGRMAQFADADLQGFRLSAPGRGMMSSCWAPDLFLRVLVLKPIKP